jgi:hypothetical protein
MPVSSNKPKMKKMQESPPTNEPLISLTLLITPTLNEKLKQIAEASKKPVENIAGELLETRVKAHEENVDRLVEAIKKAREEDVEQILSELAALIASGGRKKRVTH